MGPMTTIILLFMTICLVAGVIMIRYGVQRSRRRLVCSQCEAKNQADAKFCRKCGAELS